MELLPLVGMAGTAATAAGVTGTAATIASAASTIGTILSAGGSIIGGIQKKNEANFEAAQLNQNAGQARAGAERAADQQRKQKVLLESRGQAVAAASGGGAADPTVVDTTGQIEQEGTLRELNALYEGEDRARGMEGQAAAKNYEGSQAMTAGIIGGASDLFKGTIMDGSSSMYDKYATKKPASSSYYPGTGSWVDWNT